MKRANLLHRCTIILLRGILLLSQITAVGTFSYDKERQRFNQSSFLRSTAIILLLALTIQFLIGIGSLHVDRNSVPLKYLLASGMLILVRLHVLWCAGEFVKILNDMGSFLKQLRRLQTDRNIFRLSHLILLLLVLQSLLRTMSCIFMALRFNEIFKYYMWRFFAFWLLFAVLCTFLLQISINMCLLIVSIACYDLLQRSTARISMLQANLCVQRVQLEQLRCLSQDILQLRSFLFKLTMRIIQHFHFHWLCMLICWFFTTVIFQAKLYYQAIAMLNFILYCSIFDLLMWKSNLSRKLRNFHLTNYHRIFDETIEKFLHFEIIERVSVSFYGIPLDMNFVWKLLTISMFSQYTSYKTNSVLK